MKGASITLQDSFFEFIGTYSGRDPEEIQEKNSLDVNNDHLIVYVDDSYMCTLSVVFVKCL